MRVKKFRQTKFIFQIFGISCMTPEEDIWKTNPESCLPTPAWFQIISENVIILTVKGKAELFAKQFASNSTLDSSVDQLMPAATNFTYKMYDIIFKDS